MTSTLSSEQIQSFVSVIHANFTNSTALRGRSVVLELHGGTDSEVGRVAPSATAFPHRDKLLLHQFSSIALSGSNYNPSFYALKSFRESITNMTAEDNWGMYANYVDTELMVPEAQELYWGTNLVRLQTIKSSLDPHDLFWNPQGVRPL